MMRVEPTKNFRPQKRIRLREWPNLGVASAAGLPSALHFDEAESVSSCACVLMATFWHCFLAWSMWMWMHRCTGVIIHPIQSSNEVSTIVGLAT